MRKQYQLFLILIVLLALHLFLLIKLKFTAWPEMLLWPYLWLQGTAPYRDIAIAHTPILVAKLAIFYKLFGIGVLQLKIFTWLTVILTDILLFLISNKLWKRNIAILSLCVYLVLQLFYEGNGLWFDLMLAPLVLIAYYFTYFKKYFLSGIMFGLMVLTKQTAFWFIFPIFIAIVTQKRSEVKEKIIKFTTGFAFILIPFLLILLASGLLYDFYKWAINFGIFILPGSTGQIQIPDIKNLIVSIFPFSIFIPLLLIKKMKIKNLAIWSLSGIMGAYPRFEYFHFQPGIVFLALGTGIFFATFNKKSILSNILIPIYSLGSFYLLFSFIVRNYAEGVRFYESDVTNVVTYVKNNTHPGDMIFVMNWWDNIYPLTETLPATKPWVPQLSWYQEQKGIQEKEVQDLEKNLPKIVILQDVSAFGLSSYVPDKVYNFVSSNYKVKEKIGNINILVPK